MDRYQLSAVEAQRIVSVLSETLEKLSFLGRFVAGS